MDFKEPGSKESDSEEPEREELDKHKGGDEEDEPIDFYEDADGARTPFPFCGGAETPAVDGGRECNGAETDSEGTDRKGMDSKEPDSKESDSEGSEREELNKHKGAEEDDEPVDFYEDPGEALKPCPFCGGAAIESYAAGNRFINCEDCGAAMKKNTESLARSAWNARV